MMTEDNEMFNARNRSVRIVESSAEMENPRFTRTRKMVHDAGRQILLGSGPSAVTHAAVAGLAELSRTTLYKHWPTRADLLIEVCQASKPQPAAAPSGDLRTDLLRLVLHVADNLTQPESRKMFASMLAQSQWDDEAKEAQAALIGVGIADLRAVLDTAEQEGRLRPGVDATETASCLLGPTFFAALVGDLQLDEARLEAIVDAWLATC